MSTHRQEMTPQQTECTVCQGLGAFEVTGKRCLTCGGSGWVRTVPLAQTTTTQESER